MEFDNPILQNEAHIKALSRIIGERVTYIPVIAFFTNGELHVSAEHAHVIYSSQVRKLIRSYSEPIMSSEQAQKIYESLVANNITDENVRAQHSVRAQQNKNNYLQRQEETLSNGRCPSCGGKLVKRQGKYGGFYGCSNYPKCKFTKPIE